MTHAGLTWFRTVSRIHSAIRTHEYLLCMPLLSSKLEGVNFFTDLIAP